MSSGLVRGRLKLGIEVLDSVRDELKGIGHVTFRQEKLAGALWWASFAVKMDWHAREEVWTRKSIYSSIY